MSILLLLVLSLSVFVLLIIHSYFLRGARITFSFFFFASLWAVRKELIVPKIFTTPYEFLDKNIPVIISQLTASIGWVYAFYVSWSLAERILERTSRFKDKLFATLLLSILIMGSISYCVEAPAIAIGWWKWRIPNLQPENFLVICPSVAILAWMMVCLNFLAAFFLIETSKYRDSFWRCIFFIFPVAHPWIMRFFIGSNSFQRRFFLLSALIILAVSNPMRIEYGNISEGLPFIGKRIRRFTPFIPLIAALVMILAVMALEILFIKKYMLLISLFPILFFVLLSIKKLSLVYPLALLVLGGAFIAKSAIP